MVTWARALTSLSDVEGSDSLRSFSIVEAAASMLPSVLLRICAYEYRFEKNSFSMYGFVLCMPLSIRSCYSWSHLIVCYLLFAS